MISSLYSRFTLSLLQKLLIYYMKHDNFFNIGFNDLNYFKKLQRLLNDV